MTTDKPIIDPAYGEQLAFENIVGENIISIPADPIIKTANGIIVGSQLVQNGDTPILVVHIEIGDGQIVAAGLGAEATNNLLAAAGQRNGLVNVTYDAQTMEGVTFSPRPGKV